MEQSDIFGQPKAELHVHMEGSVSLDTANAIALRKGLPTLPGSFYDVRGADDFTRVFMSLAQLFREEEDFYEIAGDFVARQAKDTIVYTETFIQPSFHTLQGVSPRALFRGVEKGLAEGEKIHGVQVNVICSVSRVFGPESGFETLDMIEKYAGSKIVGLDLAGLRESPEDAVLFKPVFQRARAMGLRTVAHSGEFGPADLVRRSIELLKAERIGHGISVWQDKDLAARLSDQGIPLEICPTSNVALGTVDCLEEHPVRRLYNMGVPIVINTDDPALFRTTLSRELELLATRLGFSSGEIAGLIDNGFRFSFLDPPKNDKQDPLPAGSVGNDHAVRAGFSKGSLI